MSPHAIQNHKARLWSLWYRVQFFTDVRSIMRILKYRKLRETYYRQFWTEAAANFEAQIDTQSGGLTQISKAGWTTFVRQHQMMFDSPLMLDIMGDKALTYQLLHKLQAPVVPHLLFSMSELDDARRFLQRHREIVVKPASGTGGGRGVTTGIFTDRQLRSAARLAARSGRKLIVEKQVEGESYRLLFINGRFIDAIRRDPPCVIGDGRSTIRQLIKAENARRENETPIRALSPLVIDRDMLNFMKSSHRTLSDIPAANALVQVKRATNENNKHGNLNVTDLVSQVIVSKSAELVQKLGVQFAGVDLICRDIGGSFSSDNCYVGEINTTPGLHHHYLIANPAEGNQVAEIALQYLFANNIGIVNSGSGRGSNLFSAMSVGQNEAFAGTLPQNAIQSIPKKAHANALR
uniref:hypothetical protein n=1 Tax=Pararhizobium sp. IMCC3301 TaxID=3067904 RepID=UPI0027421C5D|nr:hypothetical protein [Pararhizobium sp. IMCC3301]